jgi:hypothetical protein
MEIGIPNTREINILTEMGNPKCRGIIFLKEAGNPNFCRINILTETRNSNFRGIIFLVEIDPNARGINIFDGNGTRGINNLTEIGSSNS